MNDPRSRLYRGREPSTVRPGLFSGSLPVSNNPPCDGDIRLKAACFRTPLAYDRSQAAASRLGVAKSRAELLVTLVAGEPAEDGLLGTAAPRTTGSGGGASWGERQPS